MDIKDYFKNKNLKMPEWLSNYKQGNKPSIKEVLSTSRIVFYPGAGYDGVPIFLFNKAHYGNVFLYSDYLLDESDVREHVKNDCCYGYHLVDIFDIDDNEMYLKGYKRYFVYSSHQGRTTVHENDDNDYLITPRYSYSFLAVFERNEGFDESHGQKRFAILYTNKDAFFVFYNLFKNPEYKDSLKVITIRDHGFGGNYDHFSRDGLLERMSRTIGVHPKYILIEPSQTPWKGYYPMSDVTDSAFMRHCKHYPHHNIFRQSK